MKKKIIIAFILVLIIFIVSLIVYNHINSKNNGNNTVKDNIIEEIDDMTAIDFDDTTNAKIENGEKINISKEIIKEHVVTYVGQESNTGKDIKIELLIDNVSLYADNNETYFNFKLTNNNDFDISYVSLNIAFLDNDGKYIYSNERNIHDLSAHKSIDLTIDDYQDYANAKTIEILAG